MTVLFADSPTAGPATEPKPLDTIDISTLDSLLDSPVRSRSRPSATPSPLDTRTPSPALASAHALPITPSTSGNPNAIATYTATPQRSYQHLPKINATKSDLIFAAKYLSELLSKYEVEEGASSGWYEKDKDKGKDHQGANGGRRTGIPHAFAGGWEVMMLGGKGSEEIICITPASNSHLRRALCRSRRPSIVSNMSFGSGAYASSPSKAAGNEKSKAKIMECRYSPGVECTHFSFIDEKNMIDSLDLGEPEQGTITIPIQSVPMTPSLGPPATTESTSTTSTVITSSEPTVFVAASGSSYFDNVVQLAGFRKIERQQHPRVEMHCHPKAGVPMTVVIHPVQGISESGKAIRIDMLQAGEYGPRYLTKQATPAFTVNMNHLPFLSPLEFVRAKLKSSRWLEHDPEDVAYMLSTHKAEMSPDRLDFEEAEEFVKDYGNEEVIRAWAAVKGAWGVEIA